MAIKVLFSQNQDTIIINGLYQWDYGRVLEIECTEFGSEIMEVHFACRGMEEAIVRPCTFSNGIGTVTIPDRCLEQTNDIKAWIYKVESTEGHTVKTIILPVVARTRPSKSQDIPTEYINKYAEALTEINEAVDALEKGNIIVAKATHAVKADSATTAVNATSATYATSAGSATNTPFVKMQKINSYQITNGRSGQQVGDEFKDDVIYFVRFVEVNATYSGICYWNTDTDYNAFSLGDCIGEFVTGGGGRELLIKKNGTLSGNGTLTVYKLGEV